MMATPVTSDEAQPPAAGRWQGGASAATQPPRTCVGLRLRCGGGGGANRRADAATVDARLGREEREGSLATEHF